MEINILILSGFVLFVAMPSVRGMPTPDASGVKVGEPPRMVENEMDVRVCI